MSEEGRALGHLLLGIEELLRAGAEATAALRARAPRDNDPGEEGPTAPLLDEVRAALRREVARWELRGDGDPAAGRVRDLFEAILDVIDSAGERSRPEEPSRPEEGAQTRPEDRKRKSGTRAPRRGVQR